MDKNKYIIREFKIVHQQSKQSREFSIREIVDSQSSEFEFSTLSNQQKLEIVNYFGIECLTDLLKEYFHRTNKPYDAAIEAQRSYEFLKGNRSHPLLNNTENDFTEFTSLQGKNDVD